MQLSLGLSATLCQCHFDHHQHCTVPEQAPYPVHLRRMLRLVGCSREVQLFLERITNPKNDDLNTPAVQQRSARAGQAYPAQQSGITGAV